MSTTHKKKLAENFKTAVEKSHPGCRVDNVSVDGNTIVFSFAIADIKSATIPLYWTVNRIVNGALEVCADLPAAVDCLGLEVDESIVSDARKGLEKVYGSTVDILTVTPLLMSAVAKVEAVIRVKPGKVFSNDTGIQVLSVTDTGNIHLLLDDEDIDSLN